MDRIIKSLIEREKILFCHFGQILINSIDHRPKMAAFSLKTFRLYYFGALTLLRKSCLCSKKLFDAVNISVPIETRAGENRKI